MSLEEKIVLNTEELGSVSGGAGSPDPTEKYEELKKAWEDMGFPEHGYTIHALQAYAEEWEAAGYKPGAKTFLKQFKTW